MTPLLFIPILLFFHFNQIQSSPPSGDYYGVLRMSSDIYRFYLDCNQDTPRLFIIHRKSHQMPLDTIFFTNDSLKFRLKEYFSTFAGIYNRNTNTINGQWTNEDFKKYPLKFIPALRDTITGLYPRKTKTPVGASLPAVCFGMWETCALDITSLQTWVILEMSKMSN